MFITIDNNQDIYVTNDYINVFNPNYTSLDVRKFSMDVTIANNPKE
ncbi:MAG: hypothetical protein AB8U25_01840 [Rickettsiales endosymbiont of Dermacentor nuttalli]